MGKEDSSLGHHDLFSTYDDNNRNIDWATMSLGSDLIYAYWSALAVGWSGGEAKVSGIWKKGSFWDVCCWGASFFFSLHLKFFERWFVEDEIAICIKSFQNIFTSGMDQITPGIPQGVNYEIDETNLKG